MKLVLLLFIMNFYALDFKLCPPEKFDVLVEKVKFGSKVKDVKDFFAKRIEQFYMQLIAVEKSIIEQDKLKKKMKDRIRMLDKNFVEFKGQQTGYNVSVIKDEFRHHSKESMFFIKEEEYQLYFFFSKNRLWKIVYVLTSKAEANALLGKLKRLYQPAKDRKNTFINNGIMYQLQDKTDEFDSYVLRIVDLSLQKEVEKERSLVKTMNKEDRVEEKVKNILKQSQEKPKDDVDNVLDEILNE